MSETLHDLSPMPFGKHKGKPMQDVPADYFFWLWTEGGKVHQHACPVHQYIKVSMEALKKEHPDGIWDEE